MHNGAARRHDEDMSLTIGRGPFGEQSAGTFDFKVPGHVVYVEDFPRRVHATKAGRTVVDSNRVKLVHESGRLPRYSFPSDDVSLKAEADPIVDGHLVVAWSEVDAWFEEDEEVFVHVRDPYHRIDTFSTSRRVRVSIDGVTLAESTTAKALYESGLPVRYYLPQSDIRLDLLEASDHVTQCAYKGTADHLSATVDGRLHADVAWSYREHVWREAEPVRDRICFYNERTDIDIDGVPLTRPTTPWSR